MHNKTNYFFDKTDKIIKNYQKKNKFLKNKIKILSYENNKGKGYALKRGIKLARYDWILTIDADISVSIHQIVEWIKNSNINQKYYIYFGSRNLINSNIKFKMYRKIIGLIFH